MTIYPDSDPRFGEPPDDPYRVWERLAVACGHEPGKKTGGELLFDYRQLMNRYREVSSQTCTGWRTRASPRTDQCERPLCPACWHIRQTNAAKAILASTGPYWHVISTNEVPSYKELAPAVLKRFHCNQTTFRLVAWIVAPFLDWSVDGYGDIGLPSWRKVGVFCTDRPIRPRSGLVEGGRIDRDEFGDIESAFDRWCALNPHPGPLLDYPDFHQIEFSLDRVNNTYGCVHATENYGDKERRKRRGNGAKQTPGSSEPMQNMGLQGPALG